MKKAILFLAILACGSCLELESSDEDVCVQEVDVEDEAGNHYTQYVLCDEIN
jgi:hypothetical protein